MANGSKTEKAARRRGRPRKRKNTELVAGDVDQTEGQDPAKKKAATENFLALYFREMAALSVLKPEEEFRAAKQIEALERTLWSHMLSHPRLLPMLVKLLVAKLDPAPAELTRLRTHGMQVAAHSTAKSRERFNEMCLNCGELLHGMAQDRQLLVMVLGELKRISRGDRKLFNHGRAPVNIRSKSFLSYYHRAHALFTRAQRARNEFVKANLRLVVSIARRFNHGRMPLNDLIQEGNIGLIKAVERYDYHRGYRFSTYASWWIRHAISRALADKGRAVRLPVHMLDAYQKVSRAFRELSSRLHRPPTTEELGVYTKIGTVKVEKILGYMSDQNLSLDRTISEGDDRRFVEMLTDPDAVTAQDWLQERSMTDQVTQIMGDLKPIESDVLRKRFGLEATWEQTLKEIGDAYSLSRERIRQIQEQALGKIRVALRQRDVI